MSIREKYHVVFGIPCLTGSVRMEFHMSVLAMEKALNEAQMNRAYITRIGDAYLSKVRSKLVTAFLNDYPRADCFFFLDDDISFPAEKVIEFIRRPEDVVAGIYPKKSDDLDFPVELMCDADTGELIERDGLFQSRGVPTGFLRIKRHVLEKMADASGIFRTADEMDGKETLYHNIFEMGMGPDGWWWGEDYAFCQKWIALGGEIWVDPNIEFTHGGMKLWKNNLATHLPTFREKAKAAAEEKKRKEAEFLANEEKAAEVEA